MRLVREYPEENQIYVVSDDDVSHAYYTKRFPGNNEEQKKLWKLQYYGPHDYYWPKIITDKEVMALRLIK